MGTLVIRCKLQADLLAADAVVVSGHRAQASGPLARLEALGCVRAPGMNHCVWRSG